jgi:hypothetical protein
VNCLNVQAFVRKIVCVFGQSQAQVVCVDAGIEDVQIFLLGRKGRGPDDEHGKRIKNPEEQDAGLCHRLFFSPPSRGRKFDA